MQDDDQQRLFDQWLKSHRGLFFKVVRAYAFTPDDQEDLFQEIATQVWRSVPNFRGDAAVTTWIYRVALNAAIAWTRKEWKHREGKQSVDGVDLAILQASPVADPRIEWLYAQIRELNEIDRSLTLLLLDGFSYKEMASVLGITENHVGVKISRIKVTVVNVPFVAPIRWSGGANQIRAEKLGQPCGQQFIIQNRCGGASGSIWWTTSARISR
jgi:RNA polymerase sigma-70 factor (ECF subfamily)